MPHMPAHCSGTGDAERKRYDHNCLRIAPKHTKQLAYITCHLSAKDFEFKNGGHVSSGQNWLNCDKW